MILFLHQCKNVYQWEAISGQFDAVLRRLSSRPRSKIIRVIVTFFLASGVSGLRLRVISRLSAIWVSTYLMHSQSDTEGCRACRVSEPDSKTIQNHRKMPKILRILGIRNRACYSRKVVLDKTLWQTRLPALHAGCRGFESLIAHSPDRLGSRWPRGWREPT